MSNANKLREALILALQGGTKLYNNTDLPNNTAIIMPQQQAKKERK